MVENPVFQEEKIILRPAEPLFCRGTVLIDNGSDDKLLVEIQSTGFFSHTPSHVSVDRGVASKVNFTSVFETQYGIQWQNALVFITGFRS